MQNKLAEEHSKLINTLYETCLDLTSRQVKLRYSVMVRSLIKGTTHEDHIKISDNSVIVSCACTDCSSIVRSFAYMHTGLDK